MDIGKTLDWNGIFAAIIPLYFAIGLGFASVRWWKFFTPEQCNGINRYVVEFAIPFLIFDLFISTNMYTINLQIFAADALQKIIVLVVLYLLKWLRKDFTLEWLVTLFSLSTFSNSIIIGIPLIDSMYGESSTPYLVQILVFQCAIWFNVMIAMYEYISARKPSKDHLHENSIKIKDGLPLSDIEPSTGVFDNGSKNLEQQSTKNIMVHESYDVDVQIGPLEPSLQQEVTPNRYVIEYSSSSTLSLMFKPFDNLALNKDHVFQKIYVPISQTN
ncbi:PREDICTED: probable auxin efflux carrier component 1c [Lupinus angustifolius]|uniref:probable auxin efflux carrier component 1c n=1 Tax=Lupinus angustifolius TaxID=3871 RepID=UPI00092E2EEE|nr:PREDICTED: probable auxin efflux carrier component 1c [Lupinus angustifolius]